MFGVGDDVALIEDAIAKVVASEQAHDLARLKRCVDRLEAVWVREVGKADRDGRLIEDHCSPATVVAHACNVSQARAKDALGTARRMNELPDTAAALLDGEVTHEHARVLFRAFTPARAEELRDLEPRLVAAAKRFDVRDLRTVVRRLTDAIDGDDGSAGANALHEQRRVDVASTFMGLGTLNGNLDPEVTELLVTALEKRMADDPGTSGETRRSRAQRRHDALGDICRIFLQLADDGKQPQRRRALAQIGAVVDVEAVRGDARDAVLREVRADLQHVGAVAAETLRRFMCDCDVHRVLMKGRSEVLDVGRSSRYPNTALWRALVARDGGCTTPGCHAPPGWCEVHHKKHWIDGGETNLDNCELKCWRHHRDEHEGAGARSP